MAAFNIPWKFLDLSNEPQNRTTEPIEPIKSQKTFAQALNNLCDIPLSQFPQPVVKGERLAIEIPEVAYEAGLDACKHNLHGRILWPKGTTPLSVVALKTKLTLIWKDLSRWGIISLGKGFFEFTFSTLEDVKRVRSTPTWNLNPGLLKLFAWSRDFNPKIQNNTSVQVWVRIFGLSQEYWHKNILFTIAGSLGTPICIDAVSAKPMHERTFGQFARVLIDIDLLHPLRYKLLVERKGFAFFVDLEYEHILAFCDGCKVIGHNLENCKRWNKEEDLRTEKVIIMKKRAPTESKQIFVPTKDGNISQNKNKEVATAAKEIIDVEDTNSESTQGTNARTNENAGVSARKSPLLAGGSNSKNPQITPTLPVEQRQIDAPLLCPVSPRSLLREQDRQLEKDLSDDFDSDDDNTILIVENSSHDSIVNDSQPEVMMRQNVSLAQPLVEQFQPAEENSSAIQATNINVAACTPERVAQDMAFLKESWANIAEIEEEAQKNLEDTGQNEDKHDDGFQLQRSKSQKKAQKKLKQSSKDSYATRSRVSSKPFR
jgi:hypothetical protein